MRRYGLLLLMLACASIAMSWGYHGAPLERVGEGAGDMAVAATKRSTPQTLRVDAPSDESATPQPTWTPPSSAQPRGGAGQGALEAPHRTDAFKAISEGPLDTGPGQLAVAMSVGPVMSELRECYRLWRDRGDKTTRFDVVLTVEPSSAHPDRGQAVEVQLPGSDRQAEECVLSQLRGLPLPRPRSSRVNVRLPLNFQ